METVRIYSENATYQMFEVLKTNRNKRYKYKSFFVEGVRNINLAVKNGWRIQSFLCSFERELSGWAAELLESTPTELNYELTAPLMAKLSGKTDMSELLAIVNMRPEAADLPNLPGNPLLLLFDRPSNKGNLGTLMRSCDGFGVDGLIITGHAVDIYDPEVIVSSMGSFFNVPFVRLADNAEIGRFVGDLKLRCPSLQIIGTTSHKKVNIYEVDMSGPTLLLVGNEADGLNRRLYEISDALATIPMSAHSYASSFNVSCAATVMLYEALRQRNGGR
ncbi:MAG: hypothetical protein FWF44_07275 [Defluviitaleaceae bacterium]|nr:hypothetical protein [Defluviitaleaceae bacterium]